MGQNIGIFDSGLGGLSIYREIKELLPNQKIIYFAEHKNAPYGTKTQNEIKNLTVKAINFLEQKNCGLVVLACNTATTGGIDFYRRKFPGVSFVGVVPPIKPAVLISKTKKIIILSTLYTASSPYLQKLIRQFAHDCQVFNLGCPELVGLAEKGFIKNEAAIKTLKKYLDPSLKEGADVVVLGCTHFSFLKALIEKITGRKVKVIEPSKPVARQTVRLYQKMQPKAPKFASNHDEFYTSGDPMTATEITHKLIHRKFIFKKDVSTIYARSR